MKKNRNSRQKQPTSVQVNVRILIKTFLLLTGMLPFLAKAQSTRPMDGYVHNWESFPALSGKDIFTGESLERAPLRGQIYVAVFIASWCVKCQNIMPHLQKIERSSAAEFVHFYYVFTGDTESDARAFSKEYQIKSALLADRQVEERFKKPPVPTIYFSDRNTWLLGRFIHPSGDDIERLQQMLYLMSRI